MTIRFAAILTAAVVAAACTITPRDLGDRPPATFDAIDEEAGAYGPVAIGDSREQIFRALGRIEPAGPGGRSSPTGAGDEYFGPNVIERSRENGVYRYPDVTVWLDRRGRVAGFELTSPGAATSRGVAVGDELAEVRKRYPELRCDTAASGDFAEYPYCAGRIADDRFIWFGGDPVADITVSSTLL